MGAVKVCVEVGERGGEALRGLACPLLFWLEQPRAICLKPDHATLAATATGKPHFRGGGGGDVATTYL